MPDHILTFANHPLPINNGWVEIEYIEFTHQVRVRDAETGLVLADVEANEWAIMRDADKQLLVGEAFKNRKHPLPRVTPNTQAVLDYLAEIGRRWAAA